jgi:hypothetical protein
MKDHDLSVLVRILRDVTFAVKVAPFIYVLCTIAAILIYACGSEQVSILADRVCYVSPLVIALMFILSYSLKLCNWHRLECSLPILPFVIANVDEYVCHLSYGAVVANYVAVLILLCVSLLNAYFIFIRHTC